MGLFDGVAPAQQRARALVRESPRQCPCPARSAFACPRRSAGGPRAGPPPRCGVANLVGVPVMRPLRRPAGARWCRAAVRRTSRGPGPRRSPQFVGPVAAELGVLGRPQRGFARASRLAMPGRARLRRSAPRSSSAAATRLSPVPPGRARALEVDDLRPARGGVGRDGDAGQPAAVGGHDVGEVLDRAGPPGDGLRRQDGAGRLGGRMAQDLGAAQRARGPVRDTGSPRRRSPRGCRSRCGRRGGPNPARTRRGSGPTRRRGRRVHRVEPRPRSTTSRRGR